MLTDEQQCIVDAPLRGPHLVAAGAGTGKTFTLVQRAERLVTSGEIRASELLVVTFTNKAANEIARRLSIAFAAGGEQTMPTCGTFHSIAASILREFAYQAGLSPDIRAIDDARARGVFARAYDELLQGKLAVSLDVFPLLERSEVLKRNLATLALSLKNRAITVDEFERRALDAAEKLRTLPYRQLWKRGARAGTKKGQTPSNPLSDAELALEADRERNNVLVVAALLRRFDALLREEGLATYGDLLGSATDLLRGHPRIAAALRARWRHALVDEFQDTNPQQIAFLKAVFGDDLAAVMAVGDGRQAIYEWNGADRENIERFARLAGCTRYPLSLNRRSFQQILDAAQHLLSPSDREAETKLHAHAGPRNVHALRHATFTGAGNTDENRRLEAAAIAAEVASLMGTGVRSRDIAILLRSRTSAHIYADALTGRGIASKMHGGTGFYDAPEIRDAVAWLRLIAEPGNARALVRVLQARSIGLPDGTLVKLQAEPNKLSAAALLDPLPAWLSSMECHRLERFRAIEHRLAITATLPVADAVRDVIAETGLDAAYASDDPNTAAQERANAAKLIALATGFAADRPDAKVVDFLAELDEREQLEVDETEAELGGDEIAIMTIHGAKGLEWEFVFIANVTDQVFPSSGSAAGELTVTMLEPFGALAFRYNIEGGMPFRWSMRTPHDAEGCILEVEKDKSEERRLAYVALTRAKQCAWVSGVAKSKSSAFLAELCGYCDTQDAGSIFGDAAATTPPKASLANFRHESTNQSQSDRYRHRLKRPLTLFDEWQGKLSYTAIATYSTCPRLARYRYVLRVPNFTEVGSALEDPHDDWEPPSHSKIDAATFGIVVHRTLEILGQAAIDGGVSELPDAVDSALDEEGRSHDDDFRVRVRSASQHAQDALRHLTPIAVEEEFDCTIAGARVGGFIDLIARSSSGEIVIVDYKTGHMPDASFALQLSLYRIAVAAKYGDARTAILRVDDAAASLAFIEARPYEDVSSQVQAASTMRSDRPIPGPQCRSCVYVGRLCPEGELFVASLTSA